MSYLNIMLKDGFEFHPIQKKDKDPEFFHPDINPGFYIPFIEDLSNAIPNSIHSEDIPEECKGKDDSETIENYWMSKIKLLFDRKWVDDLTVKFEWALKPDKMNKSYYAIFMDFYKKDELIFTIKYKYYKLIGVVK